MLRSLTIRNFAVIAEVELDFCKGLNILTGETGAGKTILIEALGFLLGARGSVSRIRAEAEKLSVTGVFDASDMPESLRSTFPAGKGPVTVVRELDASGRARASINGRSAPVAALSTLGEGLVDFHGQHEHQVLLKPAAQLGALDRYAELESELKALAKDYDRWSSLRAEREALQLSDTEREKRIDLCRFQLSEIQAAALSPGEEERLEAELPLLRNAERVKGFAEAAYQTLYEAEGSAAEGLLKVSRALGELAKIDEGMKAALAAVEDARLSLEDVALGLGRYRDSVALSPERLDEILGRLETVSRLKRKYGGGVDEVLARGERLAADLAALENATERSGSLDAELTKAEAALAKRSDKVHHARLKSAKMLEEALAKDLHHLGMPQASISVAVEMEEGRYTRTGSDGVEFLLAPNPGEPAKPLRSIASGGELSRVMLALKTVLAEADEVGILVFDEVDAGVGGAVARAVGRRLAGLGRAHQVLCVTHLAQVACFGHGHANVIKETTGGRTSVRIDRLDSSRRLETIAVMLGGREPTAASRKHAKELLESSTER